MTTLEKIVGTSMEAWKRRLIKNSNGSFYVSIPKPIIVANCKRKSSVVEFKRLYDEKSQKIIIALDINP